MVGNDNLLDSRLNTSRRLEFESFDNVDNCCFYFDLRLCFADRNCVNKI